METEAFKLDVHVTAWPHTPSSELDSNVIINQDKEFEDFLINENDGTVTSLGSYPDDSSRPNPLIYLRLENYDPDYVYQLLHSQLHYHVLSEHIADQIVVTAQQQRSQSLDLPQEPPLFLAVFVKLTQKGYIFVPCNSAPSTLTDLDQEDEEESETCAICLENLSRSEDYCQMPNCSHLFHEECVTEWIIRGNNTCHLCRKPVNEQPE